jgi:catechol 2,3-dioxygenase-like lactoylglutathione lyase family enzyme
MMTGFRVTCAGAILGVADFAASLRFYRDQLGLEVLAVYEDPPYATLTAAGARISLAEQDHPAPDRPGVMMSAPKDRARANVVLVLEVDDAHAAHQELGDRGVPFLAGIHYPPWGGSRFFCVDPDGYLVEIEEPG